MIVPVNHLRKKYRLSLSIALLFRVFTAFVASGWLCVSFAQSNGEPEAQTDAIVLPELGNTAESDRLLLREIGDQFVYDPAAAPNEIEALDKDEPPAVALFVAEELQPVPETVSAWTFVRQSTRIDIPDNKRVSSYRKQYDDEALWITKILNRATPFIGHIVDALDKRYLPVELALLPAIESGYRPDVQSGQYAAGIWQFVPTTATEIGISRSVWFDGRADIRESTIAAMDYLSYLNAEFHGDWLLTLAAYNAGPGRVRGAIRSNKKNGLPTDFWSLKLPPETLSYVPKFLALLDMIRDDNVKDLVIPDVERGNGFDIVDIGRRASLDKLAAVSGIDEAVLKNLNAGLVHGVTPPNGPHTFYVWKGLADVLSSSVASADDSEIYTLPDTHTVVAGDTISGIAQKYGISQHRLRSMNALESSKILIGQKLAVRRNADISDTSIEYIVSIGDTLSGIADRFSVKVRAIRDVNGEELTTDLIHPGIKLLVNVDNPRSEG